MSSFSEKALLNNAVSEVTELYCKQNMDKM